MMLLRVFLFSSLFLCFNFFFFTFLVLEFRSFGMVFAFENWNVDGWITEKVVNAWGAGAKPLYWGVRNAAAAYGLNERALWYCQDGNVPPDLGELEMELNTCYERLGLEEETRAEYEQCLADFQRRIAAEGVPLVERGMSACVASIKRELAVVKADFERGERHTQYVGSEPLCDAPQRRNFIDLAQITDRARAALINTALLSYNGDAQRIPKKWREHFEIEMFD